MLTIKWICLCKTKTWWCLLTALRTLFILYLCNILQFFTKPKPPKGYYIYGDVGKRHIVMKTWVLLKSFCNLFVTVICWEAWSLFNLSGTGKTMVMDMFYSYVETEKKKRVHFHGFMLDVHKSKYFGCFCFIFFYFVLQSGWQLFFRQFCLYVTITATRGQLANFLMFIFNVFRI